MIRNRLETPTCLRCGHLMTEEAHVCSAPANVQPVAEAETVAYDILRSKWGHAMAGEIIKLLDMNGWDIISAKEQPPVAETPTDTDSATPEVDAEYKRLLSLEARGTPIGDWASRLNVMREKARKLERERDAALIHAALNDTAVAQMMDLVAENARLIAKQSSPTDTEILDWIITHSALVYKTSRAMSRRGGISKDNLEDVWIVSWDEPDGSQIEQTPDARHKDARTALTSAMKGVK